MTEESSLHSASLTADFPCFNRFPETSGISRNLPVLGSQGTFTYQNLLFLQVLILNPSIDFIRTQEVLEPWVSEVLLHCNHATE